LHLGALKAPAPSARRHDFASRVRRRRGCVIATVKSAQSPGKTPAEDEAEQIARLQISRKYQVERSGTLPQTVGRNNF
jgi:hypothetical protein